MKILKAIGISILLVSTALTLVFGLLEYDPDDPSYPDNEDAAALSK